MKEPDLSKFLFWDTELALVNWDIQAQAIIVRVLERGTLLDFREIRRFYGDDKIIQAATSARSLSKKTVNFIAAIFEVPLTQFRCYKNRQFQELQWMY
jgi:hypothetical protein